MLTPDASAAMDAGLDANEPDATTITDGATSGPDAERADASANKPDAAEHDAGEVATLPDAGEQSCEAVAPDETQGVFVSPVQSSALDNCGSRSQPCATIEKGILQAARYSRPNVYVDSGEYNELTLHLVAGVAVIGGWDNIGGSWTRSCRVGSERNVVIASSANTAVEADYDGEATLDTLTIRTRDAMSASGESTYGILARGETTHLRLSNLNVIASDAAVGSPGADGASPAAASGICESGSGSVGAPAAVPGVSAGVGAFDENGFTAASATAGSSGEPGANGTPAVLTCLNCVSALQAMYPQYIDCVFATVCFQQYIPQESCAPQLGTPGCGGAAGGGGTPGGSGGSSVALYAWNAQIELQRVRLEAKQGGAGALGGSGGVGAAGSDGVASVAGPVCNSLFTVRGGSTTSGPSAPGAPGSIGGPGGRGGDGSKAGSGAGGNSFALVRGPSATITGLETCALLHAEAGAAGGEGAGGQAGDVLQL